MDPAVATHNPHSVEAEVAALWRARRLPSPGGTLGPPNGPVVHQFEGFWAPGDLPSMVAQRAVAADVDARYLALAGRRAGGTLRQVPSPVASRPSAVPALLASLGIWTGGDGRNPWDSEDRTAGVQTIVSRLASKEILLTRDEAFRLCPACGTLRSPERIVYDEREGDTYLVRFPVRWKDYTVNALVWVDAPWKLLGASALLLNPQMRYVIAGYHRRDDRELILTSASSLDRLRKWIPDCELEVVEEREGRALEGTPYTYPLRHEFPMGGDLVPPAGTLLMAADVGDSGTGIVPLVPGHGPTDARIATRLGVSGWPLLTPRGKLDFTLMHKYAGLDLETTNEFVLRDLSEAGALLALLRVKRGVPYCAICGSPLLWAPARAWCLEPARLPPERRALFSRLLPHESLPGQAEVAPWPVSEGTPSEEASAVSLLECTHCDRLDSPEGPPQCPCGGQRTVVRRKLLPSFAAALSAWARYDPFPEGDAAHLYAGHRRRVAVLVHHLTALSGIEGSVSDVSLTVVPTVATPDLPGLVATHGADAVRSTLVRATRAEVTGSRFPDQCRREADRIRRWWSLSREVLARCDAAMVAAFARPIGGFLGDLEVEDRAIIARWERTRALALAHYDHSAPGLVLRRVSHYLDNDLVEYRALVAPRLALAGTPPSKQAVLRTLVHLLRGVSEVLAPIAPYTAESVHRSFASERTSLFEQSLAGLDRTLLSDDLVAAWTRWRTVLRSLERFRKARGIPPATVLPSVALTVSADDVADRLRAEKETLARLARVQRVEVGSPREPWTGRQRVLRPVDAEVQKVYPTQSSQIIHLLQRMAPRRSSGAAGPDELSVVIDGYPIRIFPNMVSTVETLPDRVVPVAWALGEMYAELPASAAAPVSAAPPLSSDGFWLVRRVARRLRASRPDPAGPPRVAIVNVKDPLASELRSVAEPLARYLGLAELRIVERSEGALPPNRITGRTRTGDPWWVHVPGLPAPARRTKHACTAARLTRIVVQAPTDEPKEVDYADEGFVAHEEAVRALGHELDGIVGMPLLGPTKIAAAWERGIHSVDDLRSAPFEVVSTLPGFGGPVAEVVIERIGGSVPGRKRRSSVPSRGSRPAPRASTPAPAAPTASPEAPVRSAPTGASAVETPTPPSPPPELLPSLPSSDVPEQPPAETVELSAPPVVPAEETKDEVPVPGPLPPETPAEVAPTMEEPTVTSGAPQTTEPVQQAVAPAELEELPAEIPSPAVEIPPTEPLPPPEEEVPTEPSPEPSPIPEPQTEPPPTAPLSVGTPDSVLPEAVEAPPEEPTPNSESANVEPAPPVEEQPPAEVPAPESLSGSEVDVAAETPSAPGSEAPMPELPLEVPTPETPEIPAPEEPSPTPPEEPVPEAAPTEVPEVQEAAPIPEPAVPPPEEAVPETPPPTGPDMVEAAAPSEPTPTTPEDAVPQAVPSLEPTPPTPDSSVPLPGPENPPPEPETTASPEPTLTTPGPTPSEPPTAPAPKEPEVEPTLEMVAPAPPPAAPAAPVELGTVPPTPHEPEPVLPPSGVELTVGESLAASLSGFLDSAAAGHRGVCLVRESPERIRARVGSRPIEVYWLTNIGRGPSIRPADLDAVWTLLGRKLLEDHATAFFLEGVEYLVRLHGAEAVLSGLVQFDRLARENDARVWIYLTPALMRPPDLAAFQSTFGRHAPATG